MLADTETPRSILIAEDELLVRLCVAQELRNAGCFVYEAQEAIDAIEVLESKPVDLLITDIRMPGTIDGIELARRTRAQHPEIRILLLSGNVTRETERYDGIFTKPVRMCDLIMGVKKVLPR